MTAISLLAASVSLPLLTITQPAQAAVTTPGVNITAFPDRDMVVTSGYQLGEELTVEVLRGDVVIGTTKGPAVEIPDGIGLEINHGPLGAPLAGDCWTGFTPDIVGGDVIRVTHLAGVDTMVVEDAAFVGEPYLDANNNVAVNGTGVQGQSDFTVEFRRDKPDPRFRGGPFNPVWTSPTTWTATYIVPRTVVSTLTPDQQRDIALNSASWLAVADVVTETTLAELGEPGGVGPGCTGSADPNNVVDPKPVNLASGDFNLTGTARAGVAAVNITVGNLAPKAATLSANATGTKTWTLAVTKAELAAMPDGYITIGSSFVGAATTDEAGAEVPGPVVAGAEVLMLKDTVAPVAPTASPDAGTYGGAQSVTLDKGDNEDSSKIRYRLGSSTVLDPTATSTEATGQISITASQTLKARVFDLAGNPGAVGSFAYKIGTAPATPSGVTATEILGGIRLGWTASSGATGYDIYRDGGTTPINGATPVTATTYTDSGVANGEHSYTVKAVEANGIASAASVAATATLAPPAVPRGLVATAGNAQNALSWTRNTEGDLARYELVRTGRTPVSVAETQGAYTDTGLTNGTLYGYSLIAVDDAGNRSAASGSVQATPVAPAPVVTAPGAPTGAAATAGNASAAVRWTAPASNGGSAITGYSVRTYSGTTLVRTTPVGNVTSTTIGTLTNGTAYTFDVAATNAAGTSAFSARSAAVTPVATTTNTAPTVTTRTPASTATGVAVGSNVTATFNEAVQGVSGTTFTLRSAAGTAVTATVSYNATTRVATLDPGANLAASTSYTATLTGSSTAIRDTANLGLTTTSWSFTTAAAATGTVPGAPTIGTAESGTAGSPISARAVWVAPTATGSSAITGYRVTAIQTDSAGVVIANGARITSPVLAATARSYTMTFTTVPAETSFRFTVAAINAAGTSPQSAQSNRVTAR